MLLCMYFTCLESNLSTSVCWHIFSVSAEGHASCCLRTQLCFHLVNEILRLCTWAVPVNFIIHIQAVKFMPASSMPHLSNWTNSASFLLWSLKAVIQWKIMGGNPLSGPACNDLFVFSTLPFYLPSATTDLTQSGGIGTEAFGANLLV